MARRLIPFAIPLVVACTPAPTTTTCPEPAPAAAPIEDPTPAPKPTTPAPTGPTSAFRLPADFPLASNCDAPLTLTQEVTRLLSAAAAHGTRSAACVDGRGQRIAVNDILVCPAAPADGQVVVDVFYQVVTYPEGDTRGCSQEGVDCSWLDPSSTEHTVSLRLQPDASGELGTLTDLPVLPGFPADSTALGEPHDGNCYGSSPAFEPEAIRVR